MVDRIDYESYADNFLHLPTFQGGAWEVETNGCGCCADVERLTKKQAILLLYAMRRNISIEIKRIREDNR
jgi:hypothetical protein